METSPVLMYLDHLERVRRLRGATLISYKSTLDHFARWYPTHTGRALDWQKVVHDDIEMFIGRERSRNGIGSAATQERDLIGISMFYKWMIQRGLAAANPCIDVRGPAVKNRAPRAVDDDLWVKLWTSPLSEDDRVWLGLCCFAGLRRREVTALSPGQVDWRRGFLLGLERKGGNEDAVEYEQMARVIGDGLPHLLPSPDLWLDLVAAQAEFRRGERCLITMDAPTTGWQRKAMSYTDPALPSASVINRQLIRVLVAAGLPRNAFTPHALRHTCVTNLLRCGIPIEVVSDAVGHAEIDTTRRYVKSAGRLADWRSKFAARQI